MTLKISLNGLNSQMHILRDEAAYINALGAYHRRKMRRGLREQLPATVRGRYIGNISEKVNYVEAAWTLVP